ncbi:MAG TPA: pyridoxamine 5'-phosphate oxidase family protein [Candidatus Angelobacter sp.]|nr:pyridoxamine 5'-phosphate oxidase family protein [Candidatus Angelobacter sp.]
MTKADVYRFALQCKLGVLSSAGPQGTPQSALVGIAITEDLEIVFDTIKTSRKSSNLLVRPACSFVFGWAGEQTVQYEGTAEELREPLLRKYQEIYFRAWPDGPSRTNWPGLVYFLIRPKWIRYSDFDQNPPLIHEFDF